MINIHIVIVSVHIVVIDRKTLVLTILVSKYHKDIPIMLDTVNCMYVLFFS